MRKLLIALSVLLSFPAYADEATCLADNIYWEARNQTRVTHLAIAHVVMNRVKDSRFPNTVCEVVYEGPTRKSWRDPSISFPVKHRCQFSWYCDGKSDEIPKQDAKLYKDIMWLARAFLVKYDYMIDYTDGATHYHAYYVTPAWAQTKTRTARIEDHIFYRWEDAN